MKKRAPTNAEIADRLSEMALFLEMDGVAFKPRAYEKAAQAVLSHERPLAALHAGGGEDALREVPGVGKGIAERIGELLRTGRIADLALTPDDAAALAVTEVELSPAGA